MSEIVLCASPTFAVLAPEAETILSDAGADLVRVSREDFEGLRIPDVLDRAVGVIVGTEQVVPGLFDAAPQLRVIAKHGAGVDNIDIGAAVAHGVTVTNAPGYNARAVAEHTMALMLAVARDIPRQDNLVRWRGWRLSIGAGLAGATLGIIGMGMIGRLVAKRAQAFEMRVLYTDVAAADLSIDLDLGAELVDLPNLLRASDFVTLHVPLTEHTRHLIGADELSLMKPTAIIVNTARGGLIDEHALMDALNAGRLRGAGLDVLSIEPPTDEALLTHEALIFTSHIAGYTEQALRETSMATARDVAAVLMGRKPAHSLT